MIIYLIFWVFVVWLVRYLPMSALVLTEEVCVALRSLLRRRNFRRGRSQKKTHLFAHLAGLQDPF